MGESVEVIIERDEDGYFVASIPSLEGCHTQARSMAELTKRIEEAIALCRENRRGGPPEAALIFPATPESNLAALLRSMRPVLNEGVYVFTKLPPGGDLSGLDPVATFREAEGLTLVLEESAAERAGLPVLFRAAWITLTVESDLAASGFTAAFAAALGDAGIGCNVMAAVHHDHVFVPAELAAAAMDRLRELERRAREAHELPGS